MKKTNMIPLLFAGVIALTGCNANQKSAANTGLNLANMDTTVSPGTDFYQYACGGWIKNNPLPPEFARYGTFDKLRDENQTQLRSLVEELQKGKQSAGSEAAKISLFYEMGLDSTKLNADGAKPLQQQLDAIRNLKTETDLSAMVATLHKEGMTPFFSLNVDADEKNSSMNIVQLYQAGLGMGDRDYYIVNDAESTKMRNAYKTYINKIFTLAGYNATEAASAVNAVLKIETEIARVSSSREQLRDSQKNYNKITVDQFKSKSTLLDWNVYFKTLGLENMKELDAKQIAFYPALAKSMAKVTLDEKKYYLEFNLLDEAAPYLSDAFVNANFDFFGKTMSGSQVLQPRWKRSLTTTNGALGEAIGRLYVAKYFPASSKEKMLTLVKNLQKALGERIQNLQWMSDATKAKAKEKLAAFTIKIGYPDKWRDYSKLDIKNDSYWNNVCRSNIFEFEYHLADVGKPVDKARWFMFPQTVNAYYNPTSNEICFPAAILQPPFFNPNADDAVNYGAIGVVIGHEMTHGFDDQGRNYDKSGNMTDWWTSEDAAKFKAKADILAKQYNDIIVLDSVHANGEYTLGENIADHGGLLVAHQAYENTLKGKSIPQPIDGFTNEQRFYIAYATLWGQNIRNEEILRLTKMDPHSLGKWRVNAALRNMDDFYKAFNIKPTDAMYLAPEKRVVIW
jgi:putative endopeptidase